MFNSIEQFEQFYQQESGMTQKVMNQLTDESLTQPVSEGHRTLGRIAWHIVNTIPEMMSNTGLKFNSDPNAPVPSKAEDIKKAYAQASQELLNNVKAEWNDQTLQQEDDMYGEKWKKGLTLMILQQHEIHHRGQMTVLMRQANLVVPSIYGPAKEGWAEFGMQPPEI